MTFSEAEQACQLSGGHLATFESIDEQLEVEQHYVEQGWFLSACHKWAPPLPGCAHCLAAAWQMMARRSQRATAIDSVGVLESLAIASCTPPHATWCRSYWIGYKAVVWGATMFKPLDKTMPGPPYDNWGAGQPNGRMVPELCLAADSYLAGQNGTFAWADTSCYKSLPFMCRVMGASRLLPLHQPPSCLG